MRWRAKPRGQPAAEDAALLDLAHVDTFYGKSHICAACRSTCSEHEIVALLGRNGAGKSTLLKTIIGIAPPATASDRAGAARSSRGPALGADRAPRRGLRARRGAALFAGMSVRTTSSWGG